MSLPRAPLLCPIADFRLKLHAAQVPFPDGDWWSVLLELHRVSIRCFADAVRDAGLRDAMILPNVYAPQDRGPLPLVIFARGALIAQLNRRPEAFHITFLRLGARTPRSSLCADAQPPDLRPIRVPQGSVTMAVIDDTAAIAHDLLRRTRLNSRVSYAALLDACADRSATVGRVLERSSIDEALTTCTTNDLLDEDLFYQRSGQIDPARGIISNVARRVSHGAHVTGLAAGYAMNEEAGHTRPVICAALPQRLVEDTTGADLLPELYLAFHMLTRQARRHILPDGCPAPVVFTFAFGTTDGPNDGTGPYARLFDWYFGPACPEESAAQKAWLILPAGNSNLLQLNAVAEGPETAIALEVLPDDRTPSHVEIWLPPSAQEPDNLASVTLCAPNGMGEISLPVTDHARSHLCRWGELIAQLHAQYIDEPTGRWRVTVSIRPTAGPQGDPGATPPGLWRLRVRRHADAPAGAIQMRLRRDETLPGSRIGGRQARFVDPEYRHLDRFGAPLPVDPACDRSPIRRAGTLSSFACGAAPVVVAGYVEQSAELSDYSSAGPLAPRDRPPAVPRQGPDLAAKADQSVFLRGVISAGNRSGSWARMSGTSTAAPRVARAAADEIATSPGTARDWARGYARQRGLALRDAPAATRSGAGGVIVDVPFDP